MSEAPPTTEGSGTSKRKRRVYQACEPCRIRKAKCDRGSDDDPRPPPCARCKRESIQSQCVLASKRNKRDIDSLERFQARENRSSTSADFRREVLRVATPGPTASESGDLAASPYPSGTSPNNGQASQFHSPHSTRPNHPSQADNTSSRSHNSNTRRNLTDNVIHTLVSKPNDALALLFDAGRQDPSAINTRNQSPEEEPQMQGNFRTYGTDRDAGNSVAGLTNTLPTPRSAATSPASTIPESSREMIEMWKKYRFVREGWLTAREAIMYVDLFFRNLSPLSPILLDYYSDHSNHPALISSEPMLCTTILTISSRYHVLHGDGGMLRSDDIHRKFWLYWKTLFMKVMYGEEAGSNTSIRAVGTIESLLLMTEWHPRALHFAPDVDGWDRDIMEHELGGSNGYIHGRRENNGPTEEVEGAARRSDRMSWMLLGSALTLAHELGVSDQRLQKRDISAESFTSDKQKRDAEFVELRQNRPRRLLYIYINQLASRLGWTSMIPRIMSDSAQQHFGSEAEKQWHNVMSRWISLTRLMKTASDMLFSPITTKQLLRSGNYVTSLEHFGHLLQDWLKEYTSLTADKRLLDMLLIEFQFTRTYINSLAVQAVVDRAFKIPTQEEFLMTSVFERHSVDWGFIQEVVDGSRKILKKVIELDEDGLLRFCPARILSRTISASILLLKATGLGTRIEQAQVSLELLDKLVFALRSDPVDELHLANRYASLLETHVKAFRKRFLRVGRSRSGEIASGDLRVDNQNGLQQQEDGQFDGMRSNHNVPNFGQMMTGEVIQDFGAGDMNMWAAGTEYGVFGDDWMCLPLDAFDPEVMDFGGGLGARGLDFFSME
ncbi:C6 transcription factor [Leptodontidium sp. MPI-SDFR-AT-0119]|nr:C6 transcription factor [Leptodontidium sp. MPI-SDFR-AT-0119]